MPKTNSYVEREKKTDGFSGKLDKDNDIRLSLYCKINDLNKTKILNIIVKDFLDSKFDRLKEGNNND